MEERRNLFVDGAFNSHSGIILPFKIDCDVLTDEDLATLAKQVVKAISRFSSVYGIPRGGVRFAETLQKYVTGNPVDPLLIVDDVLTTGKSMEKARKKFEQDSIGIVIFARGQCSKWIHPLLVVQDFKIEEMR